MTDDEIDDLYGRLCDWVNAHDTSSPSSPPDYSIPDNQDSFRELVREWLSSIAK